MLVKEVVRIYANIQIGTEGWHCLSSWKSWRTKSRESLVWSQARRARMHVCWVLCILSIWWYSVTFGVFAHFQIYRTAVTISAMPHSRQAPQNENESDRKCFYQAFPIRISKIYDSFSDVEESRVCFASKNLTPCRMHWNAFLIAQIIAKCHSFPSMYGML